MGENEGMAENPVKDAAAAPRRFSAGVVVARRAPGGWRYLLLRAFRNWDFPKGRVEPREQPREAAVRETREESALADLEFRWGDAFLETEPYAGGKVARYYLACSPSGQVSLPVNPELGRPEHQEFRWLEYGQARPLLSPRLHPILDWARSVVEGGASA